MGWVSDEADLDALIARIHSDLRLGRHPGRAPRHDVDTRLHAVRPGGRRRLMSRTALRQRAKALLVPAMIVAVVAAAVLLLGIK